MTIRQIVFDTETTGLNRAEDRVVEIGAVELVDFIETGRTFHVYINPQRDMPAEAQAIHGLSAEFLSDKPKFREVARDFLEFIQLDDMIAHNAPFDVGMLNAELERLGMKPLGNKIIDTVQIARRRYPSSKNSLDALMDRFEIDRSGRDLHGGLLDSMLLAKVYICLLDRHTLIHSDIAPPTTTGVSVSVDTLMMPVAARHVGFDRRMVIEPTAEEIVAHQGFIASIKDSVWSKLSSL